MQQSYQHMKANLADLNMEHYVWENSLENRAKMIDFSV